MKSLILSALFVASSAASAISFDMPRLQFPTDWELGMINMKCGVSESALQGLTGVTLAAQGGGVVYAALDANGEIVYSVYSSNNTAFGVDKDTCSN